MTDKRPAATRPAGTIPGADTVAGAIVSRDALQRAGVDDATRTKLEGALGEVRPFHVARAGEATAQQSLSAEDLTQLLRSAIVTAAGLDPAKTPSPPPPLLWTDGPNRLLVLIAEVSATVQTGLIEITLPVRCDQEKDASVSVAFVMGTPDSPAGGLAAAETHPRGPAVVVENWHEPLVALCWHALVVALGAISGALGSDRSGNALITAGIDVTRGQIAVTPMGPHVFLAGRTP